MYVHLYNRETLSKDQLKTVGEDISTYLAEPRKTYPNFDKWYKKFIEGLCSGERSVLYAIDYETFKLVGLALLKHDGEENKICTFYITKPYRGDEESSYNLMVYCLAHFHSLFDLPVNISMNQQKMAMFGNLMKKFRFSVTDVQKDYYKKGETEIFLQKSPYSFFSPL